MGLLRSRARTLMKSFISGAATADDVVAVMVLGRPRPRRDADEILVLAMMNRTASEVGSWEWALGFQAKMSPAQFAQLREAYLRRFGRFEADQE